ncbi:MAG TPA: helix-turn-helix domain-containing protein [Chitinophagaceae bacterium]|nr:helix-turn-helix domain-containing protein [Chitinophagaceae bacterium]
MESKFIQQIAPLRHLVKDISYFGGYNFDNKPKSFKFFADGLVGLIFHESDSHLLFNEKKAAQLFLYGQTVKPLEIVYTTSFSIVIFFFQPYALKYLFGIDAYELTDTCVDFDLINKKLQPDLINADTVEERIKLITDYLIETERSLKKTLDQRIPYATGKILRDHGTISLSNLRKEIHITERTLERKFLQYVGVTPGSFSKICRFSNALKDLNNKNFTSLTDLAYAAGYADQSHFIHHFREFTSMTPSQYLSQQDAEE